MDRCLELAAHNWPSEWITRPSVNNWEPDKVYCKHCGKWIGNKWPEKKKKPKQEKEPDREVGWD